MKKNYLMLIFFLIGLKNVFLIKQCINHLGRENEMKNPGYGIIQKKKNHIVRYQ